MPCLADKKHLYRGRKAAIQNELVTDLSEIKSELPGKPSEGRYKYVVAWCSAVINRYGFNSKGVDAVRANLLSYRRGLLQRPVNKPGGLPGLVGVNLGNYPSSQACRGLHAGCVSPISIVTPYHQSMVVQGVIVP